MLNVSTKTGDQGQTALATGQRLAKNALVFELVGTLDELNSQLGLVRVKFQQLDLPQASKLAEQLASLVLIQKQLFVLGGYVAQAKVQLSAEFLKKLELESTQLQALMAENWHSRFVLPGGHELAALLDIARTICRRAERVAVAYSAETELDPLLLKTLNRLSDYLYVLRCFVNEQFKVVEHYI